MDTDRNLLFGVLALQADLIDADRFTKACALWAMDKDRLLADILVERQWLDPSDRADVEKLVQRKLAKHGEDVRASLAEVYSDRIRQSLAGVVDADIGRSLDGLTTQPLAGEVLLSTAASVPEARDRYTLTCLHATGGIGRVWLAHDDSLGRDVALKELRPERAEQPSACASAFFRRRRSLASWSIRASCRSMSWPAETATGRLSIRCGWSAAAPWPRRPACITSAGSAARPVRWSCVSC